MPPRQGSNVQAPVDDSGEGHHDVDDAASERYVFRKEYIDICADQLFCRETNDQRYSSPC